MSRQQGVVANIAPKINANIARLQQFCRQFGYCGLPDSEIKNISLDDIANITTDFCTEMRCYNAGFTPTAQLVQNFIISFKYKIRIDNGSGSDNLIIPLLTPKTPIKTTSPIPRPADADPL